MMTNGCGCFDFLNRTLHGRGAFITTRFINNHMIAIFLLSRLLSLLCFCIALVLSMLCRSVVAFLLCVRFESADEIHRILMFMEQTRGKWEPQGRDGTQAYS